MKQVLSNPIMVSLELAVIEDIVKIIGHAIHPKFCHDEVTAVNQKIISSAKAAIDEEKRDPSRGYGEVLENDA